MVSFLLMLALAPVEWGITWIYASLPRRLDGYFWAKYFWIKLIVWIAFVVVVLGGVGAQLNFIAHREPSVHARQFYFLALLIIEGIPMLAIMFYRYYQDPSSSYWFNGNNQAKRSEKSGSA